MDHVAGAAPSFEPGTDFEYSNTNYLVLGVLIEEVTGRTYADAHRTTITDPLGLVATYVAGHEDGPAPFPGYTHFFTSEFEPISSDYTSTATSAWSAGGIVSSAADLDRFLTALFDGDIISADLVAEMTSDEEGYGLGIATRVLDDGRMLHGHNGVIVGYRTQVFHEPDTDVTGFWVGTADSIDLGRVVDTIAPLLGAGEADF